MQYKPSDLDIQSAFSPMKDETRERENQKGLWTCIQLQSCLARDK